MNAPLLFLFRQPPAASLAKEGLDAALAAAAFEQPVQLVFLGDGVWQLQAHMALATLQVPALDKQLDALPLYDIEALYVHRPSVSARGAQPAVAGRTLNWIDDAQLQQMIAQAKQVLSF